jgi:hypothetical protein
LIAARVSGRLAAGRSADLTLKDWELLAKGEYLGAEASLAGAVDEESVE